MSDALTRPKVHPELEALQAEAERDGLCAMLCGNDRDPANADGYCTDCGAGLAEEREKEERRQQREKTKAENARRLAEQVCGCHDECQLWVFDESMSENARRERYRFLRATCTRLRASRAVEDQRRAEKEQQRREIELLRARARDEFRRALHSLASIDPISSLATLREMILAERHDRCPKWKFILASDLVVQIQPRPAEQRDRYYLFACIAMQGDGLTREHFTSRKSRRGSAIKAIEFGIKDDGGLWRLHLIEATGMPPDNRYAHCLAFMRRVVEQLPRLAGLNSDMLFGDHCLCCGKALTDPASMARMIGPECAGTSSLDGGVIKVCSAEPPALL